MKIRMNKLELIEREPLTVELSDEAIAEYNELVARNTEAEGLADSDGKYNRCPKCGSFFPNEYKFCYNCGQRVKFTESDVVPL